MQPLMQREHLGFEYTGADDSSRLVPNVELSEDEVLERLGKILSDVPCVPLRVEEFSASNPPPQVSLPLLSFFLSSFACIFIFPGCSVLSSGTWS